MAIDFPESSLFSLQFAVLAPIISFAFVLALFGTPGSTRCSLESYFIFSAKAKRFHIGKLHFAWTISLFMVSLPGGLLSAAAGIDDLVAQYNALRTQNVSQFQKIITQDESITIMVGFEYTCLVLANSIADSVVIHRIYLVWGSRLWIILLPAVVSLVINVVGLASAIMRTRGFYNTATLVGYNLELKGISYGIGFFYANAVLNVVLTMMIAGRIWWVAMQTSALFGFSGTINSKLKDAIAVLLECGVVYPIALIAHAAIEANQDKVAIPLNLTGPVTLLATVASFGTAAALFWAIA
ncbi:hypothetical protein BDP27DRAFT_1447113 [Rhodocollybia butyracea]|uniref:Uncharacterized protein n=1 Tax=Rhodocollybia butyracea TaxID=206335 RepID=A0A9P5PUI8_9AGAR|nr:hypothetical protein BDP27DRAFT_1447113 [Rhodocollybia butyracea]